MSDFWSGLIPTLHRFGDGRARQAMAVVRDRVSLEPHPIAGRARVHLILPCHARELGTPALDGIVAVLKETNWMRRVMVGLDQANEKEWSAARALFSQVPRAEILWLDGPEMKDRMDELARLGFSIPPAGKGRNVWLCLGRMLAHGDADFSAIHDCDILTYDAEFLARLILPVVAQDWGFRFAKGFYPRISNRLHGRLTRLFVWPLLRALMKSEPVDPMLTYLSAFRYPLSGEAAFEAGLASELCLPSGWGIEIGLLAEMRRLVPLNHMCQTALCAAYDHRHQTLSGNGAAGGLEAAAREIARTLRALVSFPANELLAHDFILESARCLRDGLMDSQANDLEFDATAEQAALNLFARCLQEEGPVNMLPAWREVFAKAPGFFDGISA